MDFGGVNGNSGIGGASRPALADEAPRAGESDPRVAPVDPRAGREGSATSSVQTSRAGCCSVVAPAPKPQPDGALVKASPLPVPAALVACPHARHSFASKLP
jgi:hypothetical protein